MEVAGKEPDTKTSDTTSEQQLDFKTANVTKLPDIAINTPEDEMAPWIIALTFLHPTTLLATDYWNKTMKVFNITTNTVTSQLKMTGFPWDVTLLQGDQADVTLPSNMEIHLISTKGQLSYLRSISVNGQCYGIHSLGPNIIVSYQVPGMVEILVLTGEVLKTITTENIVERPFDWPNQITVGRETSGEMIYLSDYGTNTITKIAVRGEVRGTYRHDNGYGILGLTYAGEGHVLVCNTDGDTVDVMSNDGKDIVTLMDTTHGIKQPQSVCYCPSNDTVCVSRSTEGKSILVFKISNK